MGPAGGRSPGSPPRRGAIRRAAAAVLLAFVALSGLQCLSDLFQPGSHLVRYAFRITPKADTLEIVGPTGERIATPFTYTLTAGDQAVPPSQYALDIRVLEGDTVVNVDSTHRVLVARHGQAVLEVRPLSVALVEDLADTMVVQAMVPRIGVDPTRTVDTVTSLQDTLKIRAAPLTLRGDTIRGVPIRWQVVSGQQYATLLGDTTGKIRAETNGTAVFRGTVDTVTVTRTVLVRQRPRFLTVAPDTMTFRYTGQLKAATAVVQDARRNLMTGVTPVWASTDTAVVKVEGPGELRAVRDGPARVTVSYTLDGATAADTITVQVTRARAVVVSGDNQTATVGAALGAPLVAKLADNAGDVREVGIALTFHIESGSAHFGGPTDTLRADTTIATYGVTLARPWASVVVRRPVLVPSSLSRSTRAPATGWSWLVHRRSAEATRLTSTSWPGLSTAVVWVPPACCTRSW